MTEMRAKSGAAVLPGVLSEHEVARTD